MSHQNPKKRARNEDNEKDNRPPTAHLASYRLLRNLKTKAVKAQLHIDNLQKALEEKKPPYRLLPKIRPFIPTNSNDLILSWEKSCKDFSLELSRILHKYWLERLPNLIKEIDNLTNTIKNTATKDDFDRIVEISNKVAEKHRIPPKKQIPPKGTNKPKTTPTINPSNQDLASSEASTSGWQVPTMQKSRTNVTDQ